MNPRDKIDDVLRFVAEHEEEFNRWADRHRLGVHLDHGQLYPTFGQSHTARLMRGE